MNIVLAVVDFLTQLLLVMVGAFLVLSPSDAGPQRRPRHRADVEGVPAGDPGRHDRLHRHRDDLEHGRGGQGRGARRSPRRSSACVIAVFAIYCTLPSVALSALPVTQTRRRRRTSTLLGLPEDQGGFAGDPILGVVKQIDLGFLQGRPSSTSACSPRRSCSSRRTRGSSGSRGSSTRWASTASCPTGCAGCTRSTARRGSGSSSSAAPHADPAARRGRVPGQPLRVRRDAVVHDRAHLGRPTADHRSRRTRGRTARRSTCEIRGHDIPLFRVRRARHVRGVRRRHRAASRGRDRRRRLARVRHRRLHPVPPASGARPDDDHEGRRPAARRRARGGVRVGARRVRRRELQPLDGRDRRASWRRDAAAGSTSS